MTEEPSERVPFNMDCRRCEHEPVCWLPLKLVNKISYQWFRYLNITDRAHLCRQGRKRRFSIQTQFQENPPPVTPIAVVLANLREKKQSEELTV